MIEFCKVLKIKGFFIQSRFRGLETYRLILIKNEKKIKKMNF
jgi:hypothetical protein